MICSTLWHKFHYKWKERLIKLTNSVASVRERTIPTERPPLVGEVRAKFCGYRGVAWSVWRIPYGRDLGFLDRRLIKLDTSMSGTLPLTEMRTRNLPRHKGRPENKADNLTAIREPIIRKCSSLDVSQSYGSSRLVTGITSSFLRAMEWNVLRLWQKEKA
jgi:hypothetical protein